MFHIIKKVETAKRAFQTCCICQNIEFHREEAETYREQLSSGRLRKFIKKINELKQAVTTIVFISHDPGAVERVYERVLLMQRGEVITDIYGCIYKNKIND